MRLLNDVKCFKFGDLCDTLPVRLTRRLPAIFFALKAGGGPPAPIVVLGGLGVAGARGVLRVGKLGQALSVRHHVRRVTDRGGATPRVDGGIGSASEPLPVVLHLSRVVVCVGVVGNAGPAQCGHDSAQDRTTPMAQDVDAATHTWFNGWHVFFFTPPPRRHRQFLHSTWDP